ncbi:BTB/POZ domain-containing protein At1g03010-like [Zingiber officinale]|uniref:BTB/POZ domain-containing protein At1g03010-like n=1 Tax=Zingiber officinale TaxID=94328 RepID=UPI001C4B0946|nr:BTB/POZ domain-containing protein At1g03010-like [Zingiber officinale]
MQRKQTLKWPISDVATDLTIEVGASSYALHKFPLVSWSGRIRKLLLEAKDSKPTRVNLEGMPGGSEAFELAAKFCYGAHVELDLSNVAMLHCAAHYLEMTEEFSDKNLVLRTEVFLKESVGPSIANSITVLRHCEKLLPAAEEVDLIDRIIAKIVNNACKEQVAAGLLDLEQSSALDPTNWWGKALAALSSDLFQRVIKAMKAKGLRKETITRILMNYAQSSVQGGLSSEEQTLANQKIVVETVAGLLPTQRRKCDAPIAFLSGLLKTATMVSASAICRASLERRIGLRLDRAILADILIPANCRHKGAHSIYDTDSALRIFSIFLNSNDEEEEEEHRSREDIDGGYYEQSSLLKVSNLLDSYLAEIALDSNSTPAKFIALAELLPDHARAANDGLYRAIDIFLKVHPNLKDSERYRLCKSVNCQRLSQEACSHAAQNERLPVQMAVQVLYFEQIRLRNAIDGGHHDRFFFVSQRSGSGAGSAAVSPRDCYASVRRENRELKLEVARMRMRLTDLEKDHVSMKKELVRANPTNKLMRSLAKKLSKMSAFFRMRELKPFGAKRAAASDARLLFQRRSHSIS